MHGQERNKQCHSLLIVWGDDDCGRLQDQPRASDLDNGATSYHFASTGERDAFLQGVEQAIDFLNYSVVELDAEGRVKETIFAVAER